MRAAFVIMGHTSMAVGFVGIFVPLLPTTPFVLLAAVCYSRGSERFHSWLQEHPRFGPMIYSWREHGAIGPRAKIAASITIVVSATITVISVDPPWNVVALLICSAVLCFILTRPSAGGSAEG